MRSYRKNEVGEKGKMKRTKEKRMFKKNLE
jgi:hypothetical protein